MLKPLTHFLATTLLLASTVVNANASLITNGSFEELTFADNSTTQGVVQHSYLQDFAKLSSTWDVFYTLPGWVTTSGNGIELQKNVVTQAADGANHIELDSHLRGGSNSVMTQTIDSLSVGSKYLLTFYYKPRTNLLGDNGINVFWYDADIDFDFTMPASLTVDAKKSLNLDWVEKSVVLTAEAESMDLSFGAFGKANALGGLLDNVSLIEITDQQAIDIPEPSIFFLSIFGFLILAGRQFKRHK